jgi:hypothetical protein
MPGAGYVRAKADGGQMKGGAPRVVWLTLGADPQLISAHSAAQRLSQLGRPPHLVWNPFTGETVQLIPIVRAGLSLGLLSDIDQEGAGPQLNTYPTGPLSPPPNAGAADVHTEGRLCVQVGVVAFGCDPFTSGSLTGAEPILKWLDSWQIPRHWPAGCPAPFARAHTVSPSRKLWACGGHFGASQVPCCRAAGPGAIDVERLTGTADRRTREVTLPRGNGNSAPHLARPAAVARMDDMLEGEPAGALARAVLPSRPERSRLTRTL